MFSSSKFNHLSQCINRFKGVPHHVHTSSLIRNETCTEELDRMCRNHLRTKNVDIDFSNEPLSPIEWVNFFSFFDYCLTEKMHGAIACILNNKPFLGLGYYENNIDGNSTLLDLMTRMQLEIFYLSKNII